MHPSRLALGARLAALALGGLGAVGCFDSDGGPSPHPVTCQGDPTLSALQEQVFTKSCAFGSCHAGARPAASLDLTAGHACASLINRSSCVFSTRKRVVPGHPEQSYLVNKVSGEDLGTEPDGPCASAAPNGRPQRMPVGGGSLCQGRIDQIKEWILAGAPGCTETLDGGTDGSIDGSIDGAGGDAGMPQPVRDLSAAPPGPLPAGSQTTLTVRLAGPAPEGGQTVALEVTDTTALAAPVDVFVPAGEDHTTFTAVGLRPVRQAIIVAMSGGGSAQVTIGVTGLYLAEIFYDASGADDQLEWIELVNISSVPIDLSLYSIGAGSLSYTYTKLQLSGMLPPRNTSTNCFVAGGPLSTAANGNPLYSLAMDFAPDLPNASSNASGIGLFDLAAASLGPASVPLDAVVYGTVNTGGLVGPDGQPLPPIPPASSGHSLRRCGTEGGPGCTAPMQWIQHNPWPNICPNL